MVQLTLKEENMKKTIKNESKKKSKDEQVKDFMNEVVKRNKKARKK